MAITVITKDTPVSLAVLYSTIAALVGSAPATLDTLNELSAALANDPNFATTIATQLGTKAPLASPVFTGSPSAPTPTAGDNSTKIATTAFVQSASVGGAGISLDSPNFTGTPTAPTPDPTDNTNRIASTAFVQGEITANFASFVASLLLKANLISPVFTGTPTAPTPIAADNTAKVATTAFVQGELAGVTTALSAKAPLASPNFTGAVTVPVPPAADNSNNAASTSFVQGELTTGLALKSNLVSPDFTGTPTAPTPTLGDGSTKIATMAAVQAAMSSLVSSAPTTLDTLNELAAALANDPNFATTMATALGLKAPLASPTFTGVPAAPTPTAADNTGKIATTAFVQGELGGIVTTLSAKAPLASPAFTGTPTAPTATTADNTTKLASTAFVQQEIAAKGGSEVVTATGITLSTAHNNCRVTVMATGQTIVIPAAATLGYFECEVLADGFSVILDGPGGTNVTMADGEVCTIFTTNGKVRIAKGATVVVS